LISTQSGACVVSGSEDMTIYIYNVKKRGDKVPCSMLDSPHVDDTHCVGRIHTVACE
jgi:hypothetical protein